MEGRNMRENNTAISNTPITEYVVDGDRIYPKHAPPVLDSLAAAATPQDPPKDAAKPKPTREEDG